MVKRMDFFGGAGSVKDNFEETRMSYLSSGDSILYRLRGMSLSDATDPSVILSDIRDCLYSYMNFHLVSNKKQTIEKGSLADVLNHAEFYIKRVDIRPAYESLGLYRGKSDLSVFKIAFSVLYKTCEDIRRELVLLNLPGNYKTLVTDLENILDLYSTGAGYSRSEIRQAVDVINDKYQV